MNRIMKQGPARAWKLGLAFALLLGMAQAEPGPGPGGPGHGGPEGAGMEMIHPRMFHALNLNADQEKKLKDARLAIQKKKIQLHAEKATLELDLKTLLDTWPINKAEALKLAEKIADVEKRTMVLKVETMTLVLSSLTAEQFHKLQELQAEWAEKRRAWRDEMRKDKDGWDRHHDDHKGDHKGEYKGGKH